MNQVWTQTLAALVVFATAPGPVAPATLPGSVRATMHPGSTLTVNVIDGPVSARTAGSDQAVVAAARVAETGSANVRVIGERDGDDMTVCVVPIAVSSCSSTIDRSDGMQRVTVNVAVPAGVKLKVRSVDGSVDVEGVSADVKVSTVNGDVKIGASAVSSATTVDGNVDVTLERLAMPLSLSTVSGSIALTLPKSAGAALHATTLSGSVTGKSGVAFLKSGGFVGSDARATLGNGATAVHLTTVSGSIAVSAA